MTKRNHSLTLDAICAGIAAGKSAAQTARELGVSRQHVANTASKHGLKFGRVSKTAMAAAMLRDGKLPQDIAAATGLKVASVMTLRSHLGLGATRERGAEMIVNSLPAEIRSWVRGQMPKGASMADMLRAFAIDAYYDSKS